MRTPLNKVRRIVFIGAECTGKSTIARAVAEHFGDPCSDEYVRQYVEQLDRSLDESDLEPIAQGQIRLEDDAYAKAARYVFHDTNLLSTILYAEHYFYTSIHWVDERFTSKIAAQAAHLSGAKSRIKKNKSMLDSASACIILDSFLTQKKFK